MTITEFLLARIAEDEAAAKRVVRRRPTRPTFSNNDYGYLLAQPARVLAECAAKRAIVEEHYFMAAHQSVDFGFENGNCVTCRRQGPCKTLQLLAAVYADHPDYDEAWRA